ncbi:RNA polymerase sigma factor [Roseivivax lentus]|uniref:RNA polymerase sigma factor n=1 Tax=Roseivivax lentus TaxID=633194 RepID=UPI00190EE4AD|nr:DUF6596 domain-containing protein [Roseivivax lentus]
MAQVARASYGRLVGILSAPAGDIAGAEDALSEALQAALVTWPGSGVPDNPEGWLVRVARNRMTDAHRRALKRDPLPVEAHALPVSGTPQAPQDDPRLALLFVCAHPGIAEAARGPLMLQAVLGFTAAEIARAFVASPAAMSKLLVRAKTRIKANAMPFRVPEGALRTERLRDVTEAIYGCYALVWREGPEADEMQREAVFLADLLATDMPDDSEVLGLSALLAFLHARRSARLDAGRYVPLPDQRTELWDHALIAAAEARLRQAFELGRPGRFQIEAAIQSVHAARVRTGKTDQTALAALYEGLVRIAPTLGAQVSRAAVLGALQGAQAGLAALDMIDDARLARFQPYWAARAHLLAQAGAVTEAREAYARAIALTHAPPERAFLASARAALMQS